MSELPENLIVKVQRSPTKTPEKSPNIKERLNLHVKRRLQQEQDPQTSSSASQHLPSVANTQQQKQQQTQVAALDNAAFKHRKEKKKEQPQKIRRPYQRRTEKNIIKTTQTSAVEIVGAGTVVRKNKRHKEKLQTGVEVHGERAEHIGGFVGGNDEEDGDGQDADGRSGNRDKDKCPDILGMLLSVKKRALMQNPEVKEFLSKIMDEINN